MSGSAAKVTRRDIRKAFGPEAVAALRAQADEIRKLQLTIEGLGATVGALKKQLGDQDAELRRWAVRGWEEFLQAERKAGVLGRLRWLWTGRR